MGGRAEPTKAWSRPGPHTLPACGWFISASSGQQTRPAEAASHPAHTLPSCLCSWPPAAPSDSWMKSHHSSPAAASLSLPPTWLLARLLTICHGRNEPSSSSHCRGGPHGSAEGRTSPGPALPGGRGGGCCLGRTRGGPCVLNGKGRGDEKILGLENPPGSSGFVSCPSDDVTWTCVSGHMLKWARYVYNLFISFIFLKQNSLLFQAPSPLADRNRLCYNGPPPEQGRGVSLHNAKVRVGEIFQYPCWHRLSCPHAILSWVIFFMQVASGYPSFLTLRPPQVQLYLNYCHVPSTPDYTRLRDAP